MDAQLSTKSNHRSPARTIELKQLRCAVLASSSGSLRKAADLLCVRHSALSRSVAQLEHLVGTALFERSPAGIRPTRAGHSFLGRASTILEEIDALVEAAGEVARGCSGALSVGLCTSVSGGNLRSILSEFVHRFQRIDVAAIEQSPTELNKALRSGAADIIILPGRASSTDLEARALWHERISVLLPTDHVLAARQTICWTDLLDQSILLAAPVKAGGLEDMVEAKLLMQGITENIRRHHASRHLIYGLTSIGLGISFALDSDIGAIGNDVVSRELHDDRGQMEVGFCAHWRPDNGNPALRHFLNLLRERYPSVSPLGE
ncbi:LysR family transcriptional regulator [Bradyrhizobium brasilense]|uniref:LysR family transcriptional regulator n=1 Tax=Bradyrhizobium brasilense TaxID=1419277 RepID=UPI0014566BD3|nr:LysR family transcriptional regulator [Bradyrhizobium brasilense]NLS75116.1 LysR family transcriptional regulator [Bradyrhizobium brasilense]